MSDVDEIFGAESEAEVCRHRQLAQQRSQQRSRELAELAERVGESEADPPSWVPGAAALAPVAGR